MMGAIVPFHRTGSGPRGPSRASGRAEGQLLPAATQQQVEALHEARHLIAECWQMRVESAAIKRRYEERRKRIQVLLEGIVSDVERA